MLIYKKQNIIRGSMIYCAGDTIAALILNEFMWSRMLGILLIGATIYAFEIPNYFAWIDRKVVAYEGWEKSLYKREKHTSGT